MKRQDTRSRKTKSLISFGVSALLAVGAATAQMATATGIDSTGSYQSELQACLSGHTQQSREDCLKEARNAAAEKRRGNLETYGGHEANAAARCNVFTNGEDKAACRARVMGMGSAEGSVAGGGMIREVETVVLPQGQSSVTIEPRTADPVVLVPSNTMGNR